MGSDRLALVTGASAGIGYELARILAAERYDLLLAARRLEKLEELSVELRHEHGISVRPIGADLSAVGAAERLFREATASGRPIDLLVNNAGVGVFGPFADTPLGDSLRLLRLNVETLTVLTRLCLPEMIARGHGRILNVASTAAFQPGPHMAAYYASKAFVLHLGEALAEELRGSGVTVTTLCPGPTRTEFQTRARMGRSLLTRGAWMADAAGVARAGYRGMMRERTVVVPGLPNKLTPWGARLLPRRLLTRLVRWIQAPRAS
ncbi:MAG: SDR family NAD(P)-dependent oxidoreductase [Gemmatimonadota bacterium]